MPDPDGPSVAAEPESSRSVADESGVAARCASCDAPLSGGYCAVCGERRVDPEEYSLRHLLVQDLREIANVDAKLYRTLRALVLRPGGLTREYMAGRRVPLVRPLQLFLIANIVYFFVQPFTGYTGYNTPLTSQMHRQFYSQAAAIEDVVTRRAEAMGLPLDSYGQRFDAKSEVYARTLLLIMVPALALVLLLLQARRRPFMEHFVFATHYYAWELLIVNSLFLSVYSRGLGPGLRALRWFGIDLAAGSGTPLGAVLWTFLTELPTVPLVLAYLAFAFRRSYENSWPSAWTRAALCIPGLLAIMIAYRFVLFWVTYASV